MLKGRLCNSSDAGDPAEKAVGDLIDAATRSTYASSYA